MSGGPGSSPCCPGKLTIAEVSGTDNRLLVEAIVWVARMRAPWRDLPEEFGPWNSVDKRFSRWSNDGVRHRVFTEWRRDADFEDVSLVGRSHGGRSTKVRSLVEGLDQLARWTLTGGRRSP